LARTRRLEALDLSDRPRKAEQLHVEGGD
jgi:hypothetical protein